MEPMDREATYFVAGEIAQWQDDALRLPRSATRQPDRPPRRPDRRPGQLQPGPPRRPGAPDGDAAASAQSLSWQAMTQIFRQATAAAIFALALTQRTHLAAHRTNTHAGPGGCPSPGPAPPPVLLP